MATKICADIKPTGVNQGNLVDLIYQLTSSLQGLCDKLDNDDAAVTTYASGCFDAVFNCVIEDSKGNRLQNVIDQSSTILPFKSITGKGIGQRELVDWMYEWTYCFKLMCVKLDASGGIAATDYTSGQYNTYLTQAIENSNGNKTGYGTDYYFRPTGNFDQKQLVDFLYKAVKVIEGTLTKLDADGPLTDTDYVSLWYTNNITLTVEDSAGDRIGN